MAARKPIELKEDFVSRITEGGATRGEALSAATLVDVQANRLGLPSSAIQNRVKFIKDLGFEDITLGEIKESGPKRDAFIKAIIAHGKDTRSNEIIGDFTSILGEVGVTLPRGANPFRAMMKEAVGEAAYLKAGFSTTIDRKIPLAYPPEVYTEVKNTVTGLLTSEDPVRKEAGIRMLLMMQGGYRPSDFKGLKVENINFETGIVKGLDLKTDSKDNVEGGGKKSVPIAYFPSAQRDVVKEHIGTRTKGLVFQTSASKLDKIINDELASANIPEIEYYSEGSGQYVKEKFSAYDFRRMMETHLSAQGYNETSTVRRALTWRPQEGNTQKYQAILNEAGRIEQANAASFQTWVLMSDGNTIVQDGQRIKTHGQFLTEVGIKQLSPFTTRYAVTSQAVNNLPPFMQDRALQLAEGVTFSNDNIAPLPIRTDSEAASTFQDIAKTEMQTRKTQAQIDLRKAETELAETPEPQKAAPKPAVTVESPEPKSLSDLSPELQDKLGKSGFDLNKFLGRTLKAGLTAVGGTALYEAARDPEGAGAALARDTAMEAALLAVKAPAAVATAATAIVDPSLGVGMPTTEEEMAGLSRDVEALGTDPGPYAGQGFIPAREVEEETPTEQMARIATEDAGFTQRNREPEAAPVANQGFVTRP